MFIVGFFAGLLFLLLFDFVVGAYIKYRTNRDYIDRLD
jgi:hypothetical protein